MRPTLFLMRFSALTFVLFLSAGGLAQAQTATNGKNSPVLIAPAAVVEQPTKNIVLDDGGAVIREIRVGSETKSITVSPKGGMPAYQVAPANGERSWKVLGF